MMQGDVWSSILVGFVVNVRGWLGAFSIGMNVRGWVLSACMRLLGRGT
jgi:hypothetical protein